MHGPDDDQLCVLLREREPALADLLREREFPKVSRRQVRVAYTGQSGAR